MGSNPVSSRNVCKHLQWNHTWSISICILCDDTSFLLDVCTIVFQKANLADETVDCFPETHFPSSIIDFNQQKKPARRVRQLSGTLILLAASEFLSFQFYASNFFFQLAFLGCWPGVTIQNLVTVTKFWNVHDATGNKNKDRLSQPPKNTDV